MGLYALCALCPPKEPSVFSYRPRIPSQPPLLTYRVPRLTRTSRRLSSRTMRLTPTVVLVRMVSPLVTPYLRTKVYVNATWK